MEYTRLQLRTDLKDFRSMITLMGEAFDMKKGYDVSKVSAEYLAAFLADDRNVVLIAKEGDEVVGGLVGYVLPKFRIEKSELYIFDLAVSPRQHRKGIGKGLMKYSGQVAREVGCEITYLFADHEEVPAVPFYRSFPHHRELKVHYFEFESEKL
jgi:aminoglycoside 3-N-acetyltransferase I